MQAGNNNVCAVLGSKIAQQQQRQQQIFYFNKHSPLAVESVADGARADAIRAVLPAGVVLSSRVGGVLRPDHPENHTRAWIRFLGSLGGPRYV